MIAPLVVVLPELGLRRSRYRDLLAKADSTLVPVLRPSTLSWGTPELPCAEVNMLAVPGAKAQIHPNTC